MMQLVQIGETRQKTVLELIQELSERQSYEIEELKRSAYARAARRRNRATANRRITHRSTSSSS
jgi:hypothetical protein